MTSTISKTIRKKNKTIQSRRKAERRQYNVKKILAIKIYLINIEFNYISHSRDL